MLFASLAKARQPGGASEVNPDSKCLINVEIKCRGAAVNRDRYRARVPENRPKCRVQNSIQRVISRPTASRIRGFRKKFWGEKPVKPTASTGFCGRWESNPRPKPWDAFTPNQGGFNGMLRLVPSKNKNKVRQKTPVPGHPTRSPSPL